MNLQEFEDMADRAIARHQQSPLMTSEENPSFSFFSKTDIRGRMTAINLKFLGRHPKNGLFVYSADAIAVKRAIYYYRAEFQ